VTGPQEVHLARGTFEVRDGAGLLHAGAVDGVLRRGQASRLVLSAVSAELLSARAEAERITVHLNLKPDSFRPLGLPQVDVAGGTMAPWRGLRLTGISGGLKPDAARPERALLALRGGYGGVDKVLWEASGWVAPAVSEGALRLQAARFSLSQLAPILARTPIIEAEKASFDGLLDLRYERHALSFDGAFHLSGLSIFSPQLAATPVTGLGLDLSARGSIEPRTRRVRLERAVFRMRGAEAIIAAEAEAQPAHLQRSTLAGAGTDPAAGPSWRERWRTVSLHLMVPPIPCQTALNAIPPELVPHLAGFQLSGTFSTDLRVHVDFAQLLKLPPPPPPGNDEEGEALPAERPALRDPAPLPDRSVKKAKRHRRSRRGLPPLRMAGGEMVPLKAPADEPAVPLRGPSTGLRTGPAARPGTGPQAVTLSGKVGIDGCKVVAAGPEMDVERLLLPFSHTVEVEPEKTVTVNVDPEDPDFVPYEEISPYLINSIMTTEDNGFMRHRGFIGPEFRSALEQNLQRGYFRLGASSITMQMVKNVLLSREKTLSRKLQELFLTWYLEQHLTKERILEIYFNVIEFGPYLYGIGRATRHYFGKTPKELTPREAAWFSSILPNPKRRYVHFCKGKPDAKWEAYLNRILRRVHERGRLTDEEYAASQEERFTFNREEALPEKECLNLIKRLTTPPDAPPPVSP
jgi:hypothetical protein